MANGTAWMKDGRVLIDDEGKVIICDECPCVDVCCDGRLIGKTLTITVKTADCGDFSEPLTWDSARGCHVNLNVNFQCNMGGGCGGVGGNGSLQDVALCCELGTGWTLFSINTVGETHNAASVRCGPPFFARFEGITIAPGSLACVGKVVDIEITE